MNDPDPDFVPFNETSDEQIEEALLEAKVGPGDVFIDLGAGLGKVVEAAKKKGATARGIEIQRELVEKARAMGREMVCADAREADLADGTVFYLYSPFTGRVLERVMDRLREVSKTHPIRICAVAVDVDRPWLRRRPLESFWLAVYDSI